MTDDNPYLREVGAVEVRRRRVRDEGVAFFKVLLVEAIFLKALLHLGPEGPAFGLVRGVGFAA